MTAHYLIDGYNLLFRTAFGKEGESFTKEREKVIQNLSKEIASASFSASIVFDAAFQEGPSEKQNKGELEIIYTEMGESADDWIIQEVKRSAKPSLLIVVTSDRKLAWRARMKGAQSIPVEDFLKLVRRVVRKKQQKPKPSPALPQFTQKEKQPTPSEVYEKAFEEQLGPIVPKKKKEEEELSDHQRWLKAFENGA